MFGKRVTCGACGGVIGEYVADLFVSRHRGRESSFRGPGTVFIGCECGGTTELPLGRASATVSLRGEVALDAPRWSESPA